MANVRLCVRGCGWVRVRLNVCPWVSGWVVPCEVARVRVLQVCAPSCDSPRAFPARSMVFGRTCTSLCTRPSDFWWEAFGAPKR